MQAVGYIRVSSRFQGASGLGLAAQAEAVECFCAAEGFELMAVVREVQSGRRRDRVGLLAAIELARETGGTLVAARLDRLHRDARALLELLDSGIPVRFADQPSADRFLLTVLGAMAEREAGLAGERTRAALRAAKARGVRLGSPTPHRGGRARGAALRAQADAFAERLRPVVGLVLREHADAGPDLLACELERRHVLTARGARAWSRSSAYDLMRRLEVRPRRRAPRARRAV